MPLQSPPQLGSHAGKEGADGNPSCSFLKERERQLYLPGLSIQEKVSKQEMT